MADKKQKKFKKKYGHEVSLNFSNTAPNQTDQQFKEELKKLIKDELTASVMEKPATDSKDQIIFRDENNSTGRIELKEYKFFSKNYLNINGDRYYFIKNEIHENRLYIRGVATRFLFENIDFSKTIFDSCYLKTCRFINCKFEGAKFINCNLSNSYFQDCNFDYATFEKSFIDEEIFECAPKSENLKYKFARSLRLNYASIGDNSAVAKAIRVELAATKKHLFDSWSSGDEWHRKKYGGLKKRTVQFLEWLQFSLLDFLWGNGERPWKLVRSNFLLFFALTMWDISRSETKYSITESFHTLFVKVPSKYFGLTVEELKYYPQFLDMSLVLIRLISFGLFMSILIKKYNRR